MAAKTLPDHAPLGKPRPRRAFPEGKNFLFAYVVPTQSRPSALVAERRQRAAKPPCAGDTETTGLPFEAEPSAIRPPFSAENPRRQEGPGLPERQRHPR